MSLWQAQPPVPNCIPYTPYTPGMGTTYNPQLLIPPRHFVETINYFNSFFYLPGSDYLVAWASTIITAWPSWAYVCFYWDANTGNYLGRSPIIDFAYISSAATGSYGLIYARQVVWLILSVLWNQPVADGNFQVDISTWSPNPELNNILVNQDDKAIIGVQDWFLEVWGYGGTPQKLGALRLPDSLGYLAFQDRQYCWIITHGGLVLKCNYAKLRYEMVSSVQNPSADAINYLVAYDTFRSRVVVLRQRPDAADGSCQCQLEFYRPISVVTGLTDPVPVSPLRAGSTVHFDAALIGDAGEGLPYAPITAQLATPAHGQLLSPAAPTTLNGAVAFDYFAGTAGEDTLQLSADVVDGS